MNPRPRPPLRRHRCLPKFRPQFGPKFLAQFRPKFRPQFGPQFRAQFRPQWLRIGGPARLLLRWRPDRNPLRRRLDRAETAVLGALLAVLAAGAPFAAHAAGGWAYAAAAAQARTQQATRHHVPATLLAAAPGWSAYAAGTGAYPDANARWRAPDGQLRTGQVFVPEGGAAGSTVTIWVTPSGQQVDPPLQPGQVTGRAQLSATLAVAALAVMVLIAGALARRAFDARRMAAWDADWLATGPQWSPRR
jgi:hypothetical protein